MSYQRLWVFDCDVKDCFERTAAGDHGRALVDGSARRRDAMNLLRNTGWVIDGRSVTCPACTRVVRS